jgi:hypothetical protein
MRQSSLASGQPGRGGGGRPDGRPAQPPGRSRLSLALASGSPTASRQVLAGFKLATRRQGRARIAAGDAPLPLHPRPIAARDGAPPWTHPAVSLPPFRSPACCGYALRALRRGCPFRFPRLRRADRGSTRGQGCLSLRSLSRGYGFAYTGGGCRPPGPPPGHAPQLARLDGGETPLNSPTCGRAPLRGRRRCAPHAPSAPSRRIRAPSPRRARHSAGNAPRGRHHHTRGTGEHRITAGRYARRPPLRRDVPLVAGLRG